MLFKLGYSGHKVWAELGTVTASPDGSFETVLQFPDSACQIQTDHFGISADQADGLDDLSIYARAEYQLTAEKLPTAGTGPRERSSSVLPLSLLAAAGAVLISGTLLSRWSRN